MTIQSDIGQVLPQCHIWSVILMLWLDVIAAVGSVAAAVLAAIFADGVHCCAGSECCADIDVEVADSP